MTMTMTATMTTMTTTTTLAVRARANGARGASAVTRATLPRPCVESAMTCDDDENTDGGRVHAACEARVCDMAKAKCVHPARPVAKACGHCPRRK